MVTFREWRDIFWLQTAMMVLGLVLSIIFIPALPKKSGHLKPAFDRETIATFNPLRSLSLLIYPNVFFAVGYSIMPWSYAFLTIQQDLACGLLSWNQYSLLTAPRYLINPRFNLDTPLVSGLFYIAPGLGFIIGTVCGGKFADVTVKKEIIQRGYRLPQDRLKSGLAGFFFIIPVSSLIYGWGLQQEVGGLALPIVSIFFAGFGLMTAFSSMNTYCAGKSASP